MSWYDFENDSEHFLSIELKVAVEIQKHLSLNVFLGN